LGLFFVFNQAFLKPPDALTHPRCSDLLHGFFFVSCFNPFFLSFWVQFLPLFDVGKCIIFSPLNFLTFSFVFFELLLALFLPPISSVQLLTDVIPSFPA